MHAWVQQRRILAGPPAPGLGLLAHDRHAAVGFVRRLLPWRGAARGAPRSTLGSLVAEMYTASGAARERA